MPLLEVQPDGSLVHVVRDEIEREFQVQDDVSFKLEELGMKTPPFKVQVQRQPEARGVAGAHTGAHGIGRGRGTRFLKPEDRVVGRKAPQIGHEAHAEAACHGYHVKRQDLVQLVFGHEAKEGHQWPQPVERPSWQEEYPLSLDFVRNTSFDPFYRNNHYTYPCESYFQGFTFFLHHSGCVRCQQMYGPDSLAYFDLATDVFSEDFLYLWLTIEALKVQLGPNSQLPMLADPCPYPYQNWNHLYPEHGFQFVLHAAACEICRNEYKDALLVSLPFMSPWERKIVRIAVELRDDDACQPWEESVYERPPGPA